MTDAGLKELAAFRNLRILYLSGDRNLTDDGVKQLAALKELLTILPALYAPKVSGYRVDGAFGNPGAGPPWCGGH